MAAELVDVVGHEGAQTERIMFLQGRKLAQPGSNLKKLDRGIVVVTCMRRGTWSDVKRVRDEREELGKASAQSKLKKARSIHSRVGVSLLLDHVNWRSRIGSSMRARSLIVWLNALASDCLNASLFLSEGKRRRLKSPTSSQGESSGWAIASNSLRKDCLRVREEGA